MLKKLFALLISIGLATAANAMDKKKFLTEVEAYMNAITDIKGDFTQRSSNGVEDGGTFIISRPGRMRLEYKSPMLLVADGESLVYFDKKLDQISYISLASNPASVILSGKISLTGEDPNIVVKDVKDGTSAGTAEIEMSLQNERQSGVITFIFGTKPMVLQGWRVRDPQGVVTEVELKSIKPATSSDLAASNFRINRTGGVGGGRRSGGSGSRYY